MLGNGRSSRVLDERRDLNRICREDQSKQDQHQEPKPSAIRCREKAGGTGRRVLGFQCGNIAHGRVLQSAACPPSLLRWFNCLPQLPQLNDVIGGGQSEVAESRACEACGSAWGWDRTSPGGTTPKTRVPPVPYSPSSTRLGGKVWGLTPCVEPLGGQELSPGSLLASGHRQALSPHTPKWTQLRLEGSFASVNGTVDRCRRTRAERQHTAWRGGIWRGTTRKESLAAWIPLLYR